MSLSGTQIMLSGCTPSVPLGVEADASQSTFNWLEARYGVVADPALGKLLTRVTQRLADSIHQSALETEFHRSSAEEVKNTLWQTFVIRSQEPNAFSVGAGLIVISSGLLRAMQSEAELASVIAHEMAHQLLGHTNEAIAESQANPHGPRSSFSLDKELEADTLSVKLLQVSRYDVRYTAQALTLGYRSSENSVSESDSSGPPPDWLRTRMANFEDLIQEHFHSGGTRGQLGRTENTREFSKVMRRLQEIL